MLEKSILDKRTCYTVLRTSRHEFSKKKWNQLLRLRNHRRPTIFSLHGPFGLLCKFTSFPVLSSPCLCFTVANDDNLRLNKNISLLAVRGCVAVAYIAQICKLCLSALVSLVSCRSIAALWICCDTNRSLRTVLSCTRHPRAGHVYEQNYCL